MKNKKLKIVFLDASTLDLGDIDWRPLEKQGKLILYPNTEESQLIKNAKDADVIITNKVIFGDSHAFELKNLKLICTAATGYNHIDVAAAKKMNFGVANVPGYSTPSVAEHTILFLLALSHRLQDHHRAVVAGKWSASPHFTLLDFPFRELAGQTLGIIGYGDIGRRVGKFARVLGMKVLIAKIPGRNYNDPKRVALKTVLQKSDYVTLHCSLSRQTYHLINKERLNLMKKSSYLVNLARGSIVDENALAEFLRQDKISGYATDVISAEPPPADHPLFAKDIRGKILFTPHVAWASRESRQCLIHEVAKNIEAFKKGKKRNRVD